MSDNYTAVLMDRMFTNGFTKQRVKDAIGHTIDTFHFKNLNVADIISFDRKVKTYSYNEMIAMCNQYKTTEDFEMIEINGKKRWIEK